MINRRKNKWEGNLREKRILPRLRRIDRKSIKGILEYAIYEVNLL